MFPRLLAALLVLGLSPHAFAQPAPEPAPEPEAEPTPEPEPEPEPERLGVRDIYNDAFDALTRGDFAAATAGFDRVGSSEDAELSASARELARLARELQSKRVRFVIAEPAGPTASSSAAPTIERRLSEDDQPDSGRIGFVVSSTLAGIYGGIALIDMLDVDDFRAGTAVFLASTGGSFLASFLGSRGRDLPAGVADAYSTGLLLGVGNGLLLASPLGLDDNSEQVLGLGLGGMVLGGTAGLLLADKTRPTVAQSSLVFTTSVLGIATTGLGLALVLPSDTDIDGDTVLLLLTGGLDAGAAIGMTLAPRVTWSKSRGRLSSLAMFLGGLTGFGVAALVVGEPDDSAEARLMAGATLAGLYGGFGLAVRLTRNMAPDPRFTANSSNLVVTPTVVRGGGGLAVGGTF